MSCHAGLLYLSDTQSLSSAPSLNCAPTVHLGGLDDVSIVYQPSEIRLQAGCAFLITYSEGK